MTINWKSCKVRLGDLIPNPENPKSSDQATVDRLNDSADTLGQFETLAVDHDKKSALDGHQRLNAWLEKFGPDHKVDARYPDRPLTDAEKRKLILYSGKGTHGQWDNDKLANLFDVDELVDFGGFDPAELGIDLSGVGDGGLTDPDAVPVPGDPVTVLGDIWLLGSHRLMCGDSINPDNVAALMNGKKSILLHADPPYGMGKESDGVANDNLYGPKLDTFQMQWWTAFRLHMEDNASAYIWGNAEDLWRLWFAGGLKDSERLTFRSEIAWDKKEDNPTMLVSGVPLESRRMYHPTERCLFFMLGEQGFNNNADNYWEGWEPIRAYLEDEMKRCGWKVADLNRITETQMAGHWVTKSQWAFITEAHYKKLQVAAREHDAFKREHDAFKREHDAFKREHDELKRDFYGTRAYFDNTHDKMTDVWQYNRVTGDDRHGHATPKPVDMISRAIKSSAPKGAIVVEPFIGSGSTLIAAEATGRSVYGMELQPIYTDTTITRWQEFTGKVATLESTGQTFEEVKAERGR